MFQPNLGRWMQEDPIGFEGGDVNLYGYEGESPMDTVDPTGLAPPAYLPRGPLPKFKPGLGRPGEVGKPPVGGNPRLTPEEEFWEMMGPPARTGDPWKDDPVLRAIGNLFGPQPPERFAPPRYIIDPYGPENAIANPGFAPGPIVRKPAGPILDPSRGEVELRPCPTPDLLKPYIKKPRPSIDDLLNPKRWPNLNDPEEEEEEERERICGEQYDADCEICRKLKNPGARKRCWASAMERKVACKYNRPIPDLITK